MRLSPADLEAIRAVVREEVQAAEKRQQAREKKRRQRDQKGTRGGHAPRQKRDTGGTQVQEIPKSMQRFPLWVDGWPPRRKTDAEALVSAWDPRMRELVESYSAATVKDGLERAYRWWCDNPRKVRNRVPGRLLGWLEDTWIRPGAEDAQYLRSQAQGDRDVAKRMLEEGGRDGLF